MTPAEKALLDHVVTHPMRHPDDPLKEELEQLVAAVKKERVTDELLQSVRLIRNERHEAVEKFRRDMGHLRQLFGDAAVDTALGME